MKIYRYICIGIIKIMIVLNDNIVTAYDKLTPDLQKVIAGV